MNGGHLNVATIGRMVKRVPDFRQSFTSLFNARSARARNVEISFQTYPSTRRAIFRDKSKEQRGS